MSTASSPLVYEWNDIPWRSIERKVFKLQKRIYQAAQHGNKVVVHKLRNYCSAPGMPNVLQSGESLKKTKARKQPVLTAD